MPPIFKLEDLFQAWSLHRQEASGSASNPEETPLPAVNQKTNVNQKPDVNQKTNSALGYGATNRGRGNDMPRNRNRLKKIENF